MKSFLATISLLFLFCIISFSQTPAQEATKSQNGQSNEQVLREILSEIKQLRSVIAKTNVNQIRFQTTFEQFKSQQNRVDSMNREIELIKNQISSSSSFRTNSDEMIKSTEERMQQTTDPRLRQNLERQIQSVKRNLDAQDQREKRLKERQTTLEMQIPIEQSKLFQLNSELESIKQDINSLLNE